MLKAGFLYVVNPVSLCTQDKVPVIGTFTHWIQKSGENESPALPLKNPVQVRVIHGNILESKCDSMINTTGSDFDLTSE